MHPLVATKERARISSQGAEHDGLNSDLRGLWHRLVQQSNHPLLPCARTRSAAMFARSPSPVLCRQPIWWWTACWHREGRKVYPGFLFSALVATVQCCDLALLEALQGFGVARMKSCRTAGELDLSAFCPTSGSLVLPTWGPTRSSPCGTLRP